MKHLKKFNEGNWEPEYVEPAEQIQCEPSEMYCPYCGAEQGGEHPRNIMQDGYGTYL